MGKLCNKFSKILKYSKKILKIVRKFPRLSKMAENAENAWENYVINSQKIQIILEKYLKSVENSHSRLIRLQTQKVPSKAG